MEQAELLAAYEVVSRKFSQMILARDYEASNQFRHEVIALFNQLENPFKVGDEVEHLNGRKWQKTIIKEVRSNSEVVTDIVIAPFKNFRFPATVEKEKKNENIVKVEQLSLF